MNANLTIVVSATPSYSDTLNILLNSVATTTRRQYEHTYSTWANWCEALGIHPLDMSAQNIMTYLYDSPLSRNTRKSRLSHFRTLINKALLLNPSNRRLEAYSVQLKAIKLSIDNMGQQVDEKRQKRKGKRLDANKVHELINNYPVEKNGKPYLRGLRNRALLAVLFYAGLRRFEAAKLTWGDIDFDNELIGIMGGKGRERDSVDYVPFIGSIGRHLKEWYKLNEDRVYVFPRILKGDHMGEDRPITPDGLYKQFSSDFAPHDARRTLISSLLESGTYIADVKLIARHSSEVTTLMYAMPHKAAQVASRVRIDY